MTRHETFNETNNETYKSGPISEKTFVLATDLDGTFLGGETDERAAFYAWLEANRSTIGLIFVTGRDPAFIRDLVREDHVPRPDFVVGDVGTTIAAVMEDHEIRPIEALEEDIARAWGNGGSRVRDALSGIAGLSLQDTAFRYRLSYDLDPVTFDARAKDIVEEMGFDALVSDNRFFDVLPRGVSKGPSLRKLLRHLGVADSNTLVAGDTLNDLSMLTTGLPAVAVGNSETALIEEVRTAERVYHADGAGVVGISQAIAHFRLHPTA